MIGLNAHYPSWVRQCPQSFYSFPRRRPSFEHAALTCYTLQLSPSITFSLFHSELKTYLFRKSYHHLSLSVAKVYMLHLIPGTSFLHRSEFLWSKLFIPLSATFIWTCRFNLLHTVSAFHHFFTVTFWAQNSPFQKIFSSTCSTIVWGLGTQ